MATTTYIALIHKDADSDYGASFPDLPGCVTAASSLGEILPAAKEALALHLEGMLEEGEDIPVPTEADAIERGDALLIAAIDVPDSLKVERINVTVPAIVLARFDSFAERRGITRSGLFVEAVNHWIAKESDSPAFAWRKTTVHSIAAAPPRMAASTDAKSALSAIQETLSARDVEERALTQSADLPESDVDELLEAIGRLVKDSVTRLRSTAG